MTAVCTRCGKSWNVSIFQHIPRTGYVCPTCDARAKLVRAGILKEDKSCVNQ